MFENGKVLYAGNIQIFGHVCGGDELAKVLECARIRLTVSDARGASQGLTLGAQIRVVLQDAEGIGASHRISMKHALPQRS